MIEKFNLQESQLFIDDRWIADSIRMQRCFHQPRRYPEPLIRADRPWEENACIAYGTILYRDGCFHLWYTNWSRLLPMLVCYARSEDGIHFDKPELGIHEFNGSTKNNISMKAPAPGRVDCISIIEDAEDSEWPLKAIYWQNAPGCHGLWAARSRDGMHWDQQPGYILPGWHDRNNAMAARVNGRFVVFARPPASADNPHRELYNSRIVHRTESEDLVHWSKPELVLKQDIEDSIDTDIYSLQAFPYESMYLGFMERHFDSPDVVDTELVFSRDTHLWQRSRRREAFLELGPEGRFDSHWVSMLSNGVIRHHHQLWCYYSGRSAAHALPYPLNHGAIGLALLRPDGFASLQAGDKEGWAATPPLTWEAMELQVNLDPRRDLRAHPGRCVGELRVEARDENDRPIEGFSREDCEPLRENTMPKKGYSDQEKPEFTTVRWRSGADMRSLAGKRVKLVFYLRDGHLYSFRGQ